MSVSARTGSRDNDTDATIHACKPASHGHAERADNDVTGRHGMRPSAVLTTRPPAGLPGARRAPFRWAAIVMVGAVLAGPTAWGQSTDDGASTQSLKGDEAPVSPQPSAQGAQHDRLMQEMRGKPGESEEDRQRRLREAANADLQNFVRHVNPDKLKRLEAATDLSYVRVLVRGTLPLVGLLRELASCEQEAKLRWDRERAKLKSQRLNKDQFQSRLQTISGQEASALVKCGRSRSSAVSEIKSSLDALEFQIDNIRALGLDDAKVELDGFLVTIRAQRVFVNNVGDRFERAQHLEASIRERLVAVFNTGKSKSQGTVVPKFPEKR